MKLERKLSQYVLILVIPIIDVLAPAHNYRKMHRYGIVLGVRAIERNRVEGHAFPQYNVYGETGRARRTMKQRVPFYTTRRTCNPASEKYPHYATFLHNL